MVSGSSCLCCGATQCSVVSLSEDEKPPVIRAGTTAEEKKAEEKKEGSGVQSRTQRRRDQRQNQNPGGAGKKSLEQAIATAPWKRARIARLLQIQVLIDAPSGSLHRLN